MHPQILIFVAEKPRGYLPLHRRTEPPEPSGDRFLRLAR